MSTTMRPIRSKEKRSFNFDPRVAKWVFGHVRHAGVSEFIENFLITEWVKSRAPYREEVYKTLLPVILKTPALKEALLRALDEDDAFALGTTLRRAENQKSA